MLKTNTTAEEDTLGGRISMARETSGLTIAEAAKSLGVQASSWKAWETDRAAPRANRLTMMAGLLGVSPSWLLGGKGTGPVERPRPKMATLLHKLEAATRDAAAAHDRVQELVRGIQAYDMHAAREQGEPG